MASPPEIPIVIKAGFKGLKIWQKIAAILAFLGLLALSAVSTIEHFEKVAQKRDYEKLLQERDKQFESTKKTWRNVVASYQDSVKVARAERLESQLRFGILQDEYKLLKSLHDEQKNIVARFDTTDRLNELGRISAAKGIR